MGRDANHLPPPSVKGEEQPELYPHKEAKAQCGP
jgi:hypothetical protein